MAENVEIVCIGCGKKYTATLGNIKITEKQTVAAKCDCGTYTEISGTLGTKKGQEWMQHLNEILAKAVPVIQEIRQAKMKGVDTGIGEALSELSKELALEILKENPELREALKDYVHDNLQRYLHPNEEKF